ncbi:hypothetical protein [Intrasporangium flavum]|uniref:hypothetical protein n=1 Tax=Intrasporangium flavum TaxID=1428657 RepID=UPI00096E3E10|nr:hypothetical protein [Intrasporangium flavum]
MSRTHPAPSRPGDLTDATNAAGRPDPARQAYLVLRTAFTVAPIVFGADKFAHLLVDWDRYLAPQLAHLSPLTVHQTMYVVGVVEIVAGVVVAVWPRLGAPVVAVWLAGIIVNLLLVGGYGDIALRDLGLLLAAVALSRLAVVYDRRPVPWGRARAS